MPKPFSFYPCGFSGNTVVCNEYYENCFEEIYKGKKGFLYECEDIKNIENPTTINCAYTCEEPVKVSKCIEIEDVYNKFMEYKEMDLFEIKSFEQISEKELNFVYDDMKRTIKQYDLKNNPDSPMSGFIKLHFSKVWME